METVKVITITVNELEEIVRRAVADEFAQHFGAVQSKGQNGDSKEEYLDTTRVCEELHISTQTFRKYRKQRRIPFIQRGRKIYVKRSDLDAFQEANRIAARR